MCQIHNDIFCLSVSKIGAELDELCIHDINILWKKNKLWNAQSPILFPIVGRLKDGYYIYKDNRYAMPIHGFIKNQVFEVRNWMDTMVELSSTYNEETLKMYPFRYELNITYQLIENVLRISFELKNLGDETMIFGIGFHPGFAYSGLQKLLGENIRLSFFPEKLSSISFNPSFVIGKSEDNLHNIKELSDISEQLIVKRTLCYQGLKKVDLKSKKKTLRIVSDMPYMAFWQSEPENPKFLCIEPWYSLPDEDNTNHELKDKQYLQSLKANECFKTYIEVSLIEEGV